MSEQFSPAPFSFIGETERTETLDSWGCVLVGAARLAEVMPNFQSAKVTVIDPDLSRLDSYRGLGDFHGFGIAALIQSIVPSAQVCMQEVGGEPKVLLSAVQAAINQHTDVINLSMGLSPYMYRGSGQDLIAKKLIGWHVQKGNKTGSLIVAASGYDYHRMEDTFGRYDSVILVGGMAKDGKPIESTDPNRIDIYAPAELFAPADSNRMGTILSSHSAAAAYVSAACAAAVSAVGRNPETIKNLILNTAQEVHGLKMIDMDKLTNALNMRKK